MKNKQLYCTNYFLKKICFFSTGLLIIINICLYSGENMLAASSDALPPDMQAKLFLTALTYVNNLTKGDDNIIEIGFVYFPDAVHSRQQALELMNACGKYQDKTVGGHAFKNVLIEYHGRENMRDTITMHGIEALYIAECSTATCVEVTRITREMKILSLTSDKQQIADCGTSLGIALEEGKPKIYLNLQSAQAESMEFSSKLIRVATVVFQN